MKTYLEREREREREHSKPARSSWTPHITRQSWLAGGAAVGAAGRVELRASAPRNFRAAPVIESIVRKLDGRVESREGREPQGQKVMRSESHKGREP